MDNLFKIKKTINFDKIKRWIIIYDTKNIKKKKKLFAEHKSIVEFFHKDIKSVSGNSQRNYALEYLNKKKIRIFLYISLMMIIFYTKIFTK